MDGRPIFLFPSMKSGIFMDGRKDAHALGNEITIVIIDIMLNTIHYFYLTRLNFKEKILVSKSLL